jgi:hypothetical protein
MDMGEMMKHAQQLQEKLSKVQEELGSKMVTGSAGAGMVSVTVNGRSELIGIVIEKELINPNEPQVLQDLVLAAVNDGLRKAKDLGKGELGKLTGGLRIPGLF